MTILNQLTGRTPLLGMGTFAIVAAVILTLPVADRGSTTALAASGGVEMGLNVISGGVCDAPQPTTCDVPFDGNFTVAIDLLEAPADGYWIMQTWLAFPTDLISGVGQVVWPDDETACVDVEGACNGANAGNAWNTATTNGIPMPVSTHVGTLVEIDMMCSSAATENKLNLLPYDDPIAGTSGSMLYTPTELVDPKLSPLTINCVDPATLTGDTDGDGCADIREIGTDETLGGLRDPANPWDFYDSAGDGGGPPDGIIDLSNDIFGVIQHYAPTGTEPGYDVTFDRGPSTGPNVWNMTAPDGVIDLTNDIMGVIQQYQHSCQ